ncbi:ABC-2 type transport system permease protein [Lactonifactor longoviformis DSM 17459]|uniref:ABC-2 type transport system permease protein n=2 Tax=Lactonifactor TaxID=420345 RepID=A0A1M5AJ16_9CLOT|nr:ABC-2 type transport system permease protein [Lactonifactor longoviformis DSM 17459]
MRGKGAPMKTKSCNKRLIIYEIRNAIGNPFIAFFGIVFPVMMLMIITFSLRKQVPSSMVREANTGVFITMSLIIPMAVILLGHSANYSQELEKEIPVRMQLFGFSQNSIMLAKIIAQTITLTAGLIFYSVFSYILVDLQSPKLSSALCLIGCLYVMGICFFLFAHGLSNIFKKFGPTYTISMFVYFGSMILCGMMGIQTEQLPKALRRVASFLPMSYVSSDFIDFWQGGSYNFGPMIQAFLFFGALCGLLVVYSNYKNRRVIK